MFAKSSVLLAIGALVSLLPSLASATWDFTPNPDKACPNNQGIVLLGYVHGPARCKCVKYNDFKDGQFTEYDLKTGCTVEIKKGMFGLPYCKTTCPTTQPIRAKRTQEALLNPDGSPQICASPSVACPVLPANGLPSKVGAHAETECIYPEVDLDNCGGCTSLGEGHSCAAIEGVKGTACVVGKCEVYSCQKGYKLVTNPLLTKSKRSSHTKRVKIVSSKICVPIEA